jgi:F-type H+-transporting ATPase subunit gamma
MELLETLRRKLESTEDMQSVVKTMKALAAVNIRHYERAVRSLTEYNRTIEMGLHIMMRNMVETPLLSEEIKYPKRMGAVVIGSEQGMVGQFNERVSSFAITKMNEMDIDKDNRTVLALGKRVAARLRDSEEPVEEEIPIFGSHSNITLKMREVMIRVEQWHLEQEIDQIIIFYNKSSSLSSYQPEMIRMLPLDIEWLKDLKDKKWESRCLPVLTMEWEDLFSSLIKQYIFVSLFRSYTESLASENASRLASMQVAEKNIEEQLEILKSQFNHQRQTSITAELLDIVAGFEALTN